MTKLPTARPSTPDGGSEMVTLQVRATDRLGNVSDWIESEAVEIDPSTRYYALGAQQVALEQGETSTTCIRTT